MLLKFYVQNGYRCTIEDLALRHKPFEDLRKCIIDLRDHVIDSKNQVELESDRNSVLDMIAADISEYVLNFKIPYERRDALPQLMKVIAKAFSSENRPKIYNPKVLSEVATHVNVAGNLTMNNVNSLVLRLEYFGIHADYLGGKT